VHYTSEPSAKSLDRRFGVGLPRYGATTGWEALTPAQWRVAELGAPGLSTPDIAAQRFLSRNAVQTHVSHILAKLTLRPRVELIPSFGRRADVADG
jgi:DNA-binding NarL/FixJ family response regulator